MDKMYKIGSRGSRLALVQVKEIIAKIKSVYPEFKSEIVSFSTYGDKDKRTPICKIEGTDFFTREVDAAVLSGIVDFAVHSAKDLPDESSPDLKIVIIPTPMEQNDALVSKENLCLAHLRKNAKIGTSSVRRKTQLRNYRQDFQIIDIRGNIEERISILDNSDLDAIIIAECALIRLGLENRISRKIPIEIMEPHPLQGSLAMVIRNDNIELKNFFSMIQKEEVTF